MQSISQVFKYGSFEVILETGIIARNTDASITVQVGDTVVLATVAVGKTYTNQDFFPMSVHYQERSYAAGRIPGNFFRREIRLSESEILVSRLIDRCIRPLCPKTYPFDVQIIVTVLSADPQVHPDIPAILAASSALAISSIPFEKGHVAACRLAMIDNEWFINPSMEERAKSELDVVVASNKDGILMLESGIAEKSENVVISAIKYAHDFNLICLENINELIEKAEKAGIAKSKNINVIENSDKDETLLEVRDIIRSKLENCKEFSDKAANFEEMLSYIEEHYNELFNKFEQLIDVKILSKALHIELRDFVRNKVFSTGIRIDGRSPDTIRNLDIRRKVLPKVHGSALFTRGKTQSLGVVTVGSTKDAQLVDEVVGVKNDNFLLHYNFLPFCVGSTGPIGSPRRREIGHGALAKRAFLSVIPSSENFPYSVRVVSEILEADGSSSMATVCSSSVALMDAGVPIKKHVAGIAMGLMVDGDKRIILSDIRECEDHIGDMDFKVTGTEDGVTALQMDVKIPGIPVSYLKDVLDKAKTGRLHIISAMKNVIKSHNESSFRYIPNIFQVTIPTYKIKDLIGKGGSVIRKITEDFQAKIDISDNGVVKFSLNNDNNAEKLKQHILDLVADLDIGSVMEGVVTRKENFGIFLKLNGYNKTGLIHSAELTKHNKNNNLDIGDKAMVKIIAMDSRTGKIKLSFDNIELDEKLFKKTNLADNAVISDIDEISTQASEIE